MCKAAIKFGRLARNTDKTIQNHFDLKYFVFLPSIVRGEIRAVEGNLC